MRKVRQSGDEGEEEDGNTTTQKHLVGIEEIEKLSSARTASSEEAAFLSVCPYKASHYTPSPVTHLPTHNNGSEIIESAIERDTRGVNRRGALAREI